MIRLMKLRTWPSQNRRCRQDPWSLEAGGGDVELGARRCKVGKSLHSVKCFSILHLYLITLVTSVIIIFLCKKRNNHSTTI